MSIEHDSPPRLHSSGVQCGVLLDSLFEKYICRVRTAHQPLKAPEGIKRADSE